MKKITLLLTVLFLSSVTFSQVEQIQNNFVKHGPTVVKNIDLKSLTPHSKGATRWYNYGETMDLMYGGGVSVLYGNILFPDSTILVEYTGGTYAGPWIHNILDVLDAHNYDFNDDIIYTNAELAIQNSSTYNIDSIAIYGIYARHTVDSIVDTLEIEVAVNNTLPKYYFYNQAVNTNLASDTVWIHGIGYDYLTNVMTLTGKKTYKFPLTKQFYGDSLENGLHLIQISTADLPTVTAGKFVVASVQFIPGYTWTANVDSIASKNEFHFISFLENPGNWPIYTKRDFNISYIIPWDVRYNINTLGWNGLSIPSYAYMGGSDPDAYPYEHHLIYYLVNCQTNCQGVSINDISNSDAYYLGDAYPNPAGIGDELIIPFEMKTAEGNSSLKIYNSVGQILQHFNYSNIQGEYKTTINTSTLNAGLYFYTLETSEGNNTKAFTIAKD